MKDLEKWLNEFCKELSAYPELEKLFRSCYRNTYETTTKLLSDGTTYVFTGDIPAMWLRDSSAQVTPYLFAAKGSAEVRRLFTGLLKRQFDYILLDPYANAFNQTADGSGHKDITKQSDWVWERKYEIDSLCYPLWLAYRYLDETHDFSPFDARFVRAAGAVLATFETEQRHSQQSEYSFVREGEYAHDTLPGGGKGDEVPYTGMTWSAFRPSDDRCVYPYLVPSNMFAVVTLRRTAAILTKIGQPKLSDRAQKLCGEIEQGISRFGTYDHPRYGKIYVYETDGKGNRLLMDDANVPSLLSLPYLGYCSPSDPIYQNTRRFILSRDNPYYFSGRAAAGIGSPHTPEGWIWHIGLIMQGLTSDDREEKRRLLAALLSTHADTGFMHESFDKDSPENFTRPWFAWANSLFSYFIIQNRSEIAALMRPDARECIA